MNFVLFTGICVSFSILKITVCTKKIWNMENVWKMDDIVLLVHSLKTKAPCDMSIKILTLWLLFAMQIVINRTVYQNFKIQTGGQSYIHHFGAILWIYYKVGKITPKNNSTGHWMNL